MIRSITIAALAAAFAFGATAAIAQDETAAEVPASVPIVAFSSSTNVSITEIRVDGSVVCGLEGTVLSCTARRAAPVE